MFTSERKVTAPGPQRASAQAPAPRRILANQADYRTFSAMIQRSTAGMPLPESIRAEASARLGHDFSNVRIHADSSAATQAARFEANAFTVGNDVFFGSGKFDLSSRAGKDRLTHELVHTVQQRGTTEPTRSDLIAAETQARNVASGSSLSAVNVVAPHVMREPTAPRRATADQIVREAERVLAMTREVDAADPVQRKWSRTASNFGLVTAGTIARRIWTNMFLRHFEEPDSAPGTESVYPRYFFAPSYGWIDAQHFFGFIDYAQNESNLAGGNRQRTLEAATQRGISIEERQQRARDHVVVGVPRDPGVLGLLQVEPPNTALFRVPPMVGGAALETGASALAPLLMDQTQRELFSQVDDKSKFWLDNAKSAFSYEDIVSNQLGIRFFLLYGRAINHGPPAERETRFRTSLASFLAQIGTVNDQQRLDQRAANLPDKERFLAPQMHEQTARDRHPDLFRLP